MKIIQIIALLVVFKFFIFTLNMVDGALMGLDCGSFYMPLTPNRYERSCKSVEYNKKKKVRIKFRKELEEARELSRRVEQTK